MNRLIVGPFNRVEGDLEVRLSYADGVVSEAHVVSPMFRGFETILIDRAPEDALAIAPRICGICSVSQSVAAARALADMTGVRTPLNGQLSTQLALSCENLIDHLTHFYLFFMPDFTRDEYADRGWSEGIRAKFSVPDGRSRTEAMAARARFLHVTGIIAGKWPHTLAIQPGGTTLELDQGEQIRLIAAIDGYRNFLESQMFGVPIEALAECASMAALSQLMEGVESDLSHFLSVCDDLDLWQSGRGQHALMSFGAYPVDGDMTLAAGIFRNGAVEPVDEAQIVEDTSHARYPDQSAHPLKSHSEAEPGSADAYSWCKAPRYAEQPVEVGAFARQVVNGSGLMLDIYQRFGSNVAGRILARWVETAIVLSKMAAWACAFRRDEDYLVPIGSIKTASGKGFVEAARGSLGHWSSVRDGKIDNYQIIAPTTWNFSPRDNRGLPGPLETALVGAPVRTGEVSPISVQHIVRSFDPCMVCTAH